MKKKLGLMSLGILAIFLFVSLTSAISFTDSVNSIVLTPQDTTETFTLTADGNATFNFDNTPFILTDGTTDITITISEQTVNSDNVVYYVEATGLVDEFDFGVYDSEIVSFEVVNDSDSNDNETKNVIFTFKNNDFCEGTGTNDLRITDINFDVIEGFGDEDDYWYLFDEIEVEVTVDNYGDEDIDDIEISWELYTTAGDKISSGDVDKFDLDEGDDTDVTFTFILDEDLEDFDGEDAVLYIKVEGEGHDTNDDYCGFADEQEIEVSTSDDFVIATEFKIDGTEAGYITPLNCKDTIEVSAKIVNIGDSEQDDVSVKVYSKGLGISESFDLGDIKAFDDEIIIFEFEVPKDLEEKDYEIEFEVYDEDNDVFENDEDDESKTYMFFEGKENCKVEIPAINAELIGEAKAGKEMVIKTSVQNNDKDSAMFFISAEGYEDWAKLDSIFPEYVQIDSGEISEIEVVLLLNSDLEDQDYQFDIVASVDGEELLVQAVAVSVESRTFNLGLSKAFENFDWKLWGIVLLNLILLIAIIIVTVKIMKKK